METISKDLEKLHKLLNENSRFVLTSHIHTDGDAVGSLLALYYYLESQDKSAKIFLPGDVPEKYRFLNTDQHFNKIQGTERKRYIQNAEVIIILDISSLSRLGRLLPDIRESNALKICIDHHPFENEEWIEFQIIHTKRVATAELIFQFFKFNGIPIDLRMAEALYTAILSDSGSFRFQRTDSFTFGMASELVQLGIDPSEIYGYVYENGTKNQLQAWGIILSNMQSKGVIAWLTVTRGILENYKLSLEDIEGIIDILRKNREAQVVMVFVEKAPKEILVGLRSKNGFDVGALAQRFGGGGHFHAAGFTGFDQLDNVVQKTISMIDDLNIEKK